MVVEVLITLLVKSSKYVSSLWHQRENFAQGIKAANQCY